MQRMAWTDERLEERFDRIDDRFDEVNRRFDDVDRRFDKMDLKIDDLGRAMLTLHSTLHRGAIGIVVALIGVIGALLVNG
jgi:hypothetical protein